MTTFNKPSCSTQYKPLDPKSVHFSIFSSEEIKELSVVKLSTPLTFDALGHPLKGGLYDPVLGPLNEKSDACGTCHRTIATCPGHFGHIELPVLVVNPLFHKTLFTILSSSCIECHRLQIDDQSKNLLNLKINLIESGHLTDALDIDSLVSNLIKTNSKKPNDDVAFDIMKNKTVKKYVKILKKNSSHLEVFLNKNVYKIKDKFVNETFKKSSAKSCMYCFQPLIRITSVANKLMCVIGDPRDKKALKRNTMLMPDKTREYMRKIWIEDKQTLKQLIPVLKTMKIAEPTDIFFLDIIPVPPPIVRPCNFLRDQIVEHPQTQVYKSIMKIGFVVRAIIQAAQMKMSNIDEENSTVSSQAKSVVENALGATPLEKLQNAWQELQMNVDYLINSDNSKSGEQGLKQIIEKKDGLIRLHMMGKRVNYAARSVITPDPNLSIEEIGVPEAFAIKLTYPVPVTSWNVEELRRMVINGPNKHPGAVTIENEDGRVISIPGWSSEKRESIAMRLLTPDEGKVTGVKIVHRHLVNGDVMLLNRQPTLHKPSIMAHRVRVLKGEKTLRLHYANCKAYNADFDGDEMNAHFPQNEIARSEAYNIMSVNRQYLVPKDGTPLSGLIQDHVISGVRLSVRGRFFSKADYQQLVFQGLGHLRKNIKLLPPAIIKPVELWSGKQILSTLIINIVPANKIPITLIGTAKISSKAWETEPARHWIVGGTQFPDRNTMTESEVVIRHGELLSGVLDKSHFGATPYSLVHCVYELYGGNVSGVLLSSLAKLFTFFLQWEGFTLGVKDILVVPKADVIRSMIVKSCRTIGNATAAEAVDLPPDVDYKYLITTLEDVSSKNPKFRALIDRKYKSALDKYTNDINKICLPSGLLSQFPSNNLQLMVQSGAKGSTVNTMQISCLLGQIELEGKRPPVMVSGRSLPSFPPFETSPRSGGFIDGRFMTGIQPQEFFFHCMAGREGLIDTAVKTSKSGYLQRCLIKHLEGITINYDMTVRDSDDSIIQFAYGEDGMDVCKARFYNSKQLNFLDQNTEAIVDKENLKKLQEDFDSTMVSTYGKSIKKWIKRHPDPKKRQSPFLQFSKFVTQCNNLNESSKKYPGRDELACKVIDAWDAADSDVKQGYKSKDCTKCPDPLVSKYQPDHNFGIINEKMEKLVDDYLKRRHNSTVIDTFVSEASDFKDMMKVKLIESLAAPGEPVGLLAAQSIGEPSTQMTLNTFHFAGRGEMNVTLGIPRLREILMMASSNLKTPSMDIPFKTHLKNVTKSAERLQRKLCRVTVEHVLEKIDVQSELRVTPCREFSFSLKFTFLPHRNYKDKCNVTPKQILKFMGKRFFLLMFKDIWKAAGKRSGMMVGTAGDDIKTKKDSDDDPETEIANSAKKGVFTEDVDSSDEELQNEDDDNTQVRNRKRRTECQEYEDPESEEEEHSDVEDNAIKNKTEQEDEGFEDFEDKPDVHATKVLEQYGQATNYTYDKVDYQWCQLIFSLPLSVSKVDLSAILRKLAERCVIREVPNIKRAITYLNNKDEIVLKTEGININEMFQHDDILNLNKLHSNDIHAMAHTYGIEAACKVIIKEIQNVFNVYGIHVDLRHLSLISDYMTYNGVFEPMSRKGMESSISPLQQMSFESSLTFLKEAAIKGKLDMLKSASSCLMLGQPCKSGTGSFSLYNSYDKSK